MNELFPQFRRQRPPRRNRPGLPYARAPFPPPQRFPAGYRRPPAMMRGRPGIAWDLRSLAVALRRSPYLLFLAIAAAFSLALLPVFVLGGTYAIYLLTGRTFPGVTVGPIAAGDLTQAQLAQKLDEQWNHQKTITLTDGAHAMPVTPLEVGLWVDPRATAARAYQIGRGSGALNELLWLFRFGGVPVEPVVVFNQDAARQGLQRLAAQIDQPAQNAALRFENGQWVAVPGQDGTSLNIDQTIQQITPRPTETVTGGLLALVTQPVAPQIRDLTPALAQLRGALEQPLKIQAYDPVTDETIAVDIPRETFASWVTVEPTGSDTAGGGMTIGLDGQQLAAFLNQWQSGLGPGRSLASFTPPADLAARWQNGQPVTVEVYHKPTSYTVEPGDMLTSIAYKLGMPYWKIQQANPGLDPNRLIAGQVLTIPSKNEMLPLPVVPGKRIVISISQQRLWTFENGQQTGEHVISTGIDRSPTIPGIYQIQTHEPEAYASVWDLYMPNFMGIYEGWPGFMNGIHGLPTLSGGRRLWEGNLGRPVSYGCIILGLQEAQDLYTWAEEGVVVEIKP